MDFFAMLSASASHFWAKSISCPQISGSLKSSAKSRNALAWSRSRVTGAIGGSPAPPRPFSRAVPSRTEGHSYVLHRTERPATSCPFACGFECPSNGARWALTSVPEGTIPAVRRLDGHGLSGQMETERHAGDASIRRNLCGSRRCDRFCLHRSGAASNRDLDRRPGWIAHRAERHFPSVPESRAAPALAAHGPAFSWQVLIRSIDGT